MDMITYPCSNLIDDLANPCKNHSFNGQGQPIVQPVKVSYGVVHILIGQGHPIAQPVKVSYGVSTFWMDNDTT